jgi:NAD kinase
MFLTVSILEESRVQVFLEAKNRQELILKLPSSKTFNVREHEKLIDLVITIGGDGTVLYRVQCV